MAQQRGKSRLAPGKEITDYASYARIKSAFGSDSAIMSEYSRQRSIIRKRLERMEAAGEKDNWLYKTFGNMKEDLPTAVGMDVREAASRLASTSRALSGYGNTTLSEIRRSREEAKKNMIKEAEDAEDESFADAVRDMSDAQYRNMTRIMGMVQRVVGAKNLTSDELRQVAAKIVFNRKDESLLTLAGKALKQMGFDELGNLEKLKAMFTQKGRVRVAWKKAHSKRGK